MRRTVATWKMGLHFYIADPMGSGILVLQICEDLVCLVLRQAGLHDVNHLSCIRPLQGRLSELGTCAVFVKSLETMGFASEPRSGTSVAFMEAPPIWGCRTNNILTFRKLQPWGCMSHRMRLRSRPLGSKLFTKAVLVLWILMLNNLLLSIPSKENGLVSGLLRFLWRVPSYALPFGTKKVCLVNHHAFEKLACRLFTPFDM